MQCAVCSILTRSKFESRRGQGNCLDACHPVVPSNSLNLNWMESESSDEIFFSVSVDTFSGDTLSLTRVTRTHMGAYLCIASNDVPPAVSKRVILNVNCKYASILLSSMLTRPPASSDQCFWLVSVAPSIKIPNQLLGAPLGTDVLLECHVEAYPNTINYWMKNRNEMLLHG